MPFPMHIYYAFNANNLPYRFERMVINKRKDRGGSPFSKPNKTTERMLEGKGKKT
jgi:hypothetical protein